MSDVARLVYTAICPGTIDTGFRRKSTSAVKAGGLEDDLEGMSSKVGKVLTVQDSEFGLHRHPDGLAYGI
jgi:hypothetical protein